MMEKSNKCTNRHVKVYPKADTECDTINSSIYDDNDDNGGVYRSIYPFDRNGDVRIVVVFVRISLSTVYFL